MIIVNCFIKTIHRMLYQLDWEITDIYIISSGLCTPGSCSLILIVRLRFTLLWFFSRQRKEKSHLLTRQWRKTSHHLWGRHQRRKVVNSSSLVPSLNCPSWERRRTCHGLRRMIFLGLLQRTDTEIQYICQTPLTLSPP